MPALELLERGAPGAAGGRVLRLAPSPRLRRGAHGPPRRPARGGRGMARGDLVTGGLQHDRLAAMVESGLASAPARQPGEDAEGAGSARRATTTCGRRWPRRRSWSPRTSPRQPPSRASAQHAQRVRRRLGEPDWSLRPSRADDRQRGSPCSPTRTRRSTASPPSCSRSPTTPSSSDWPFTARLLRSASAAASPAARPSCRSTRSRSTSTRSSPCTSAPSCELLRWCEDERIECIHAATPGPGGPGRLRCWPRSLDLPLVATYHTDLPRLAYFLTRDHVCWRSHVDVRALFYSQCDIVLCPSRLIQEDLADHGVRGPFAPFEQAVDGELLLAGASQRGDPPASWAAARRSCSGSAGSRPRRGSTCWPRSTPRCARGATTCAS